MRIGKLLLLLSFCFLIQSTFAQKSKSQLEREKQENQRKIQEATTILKETQSQKKSTLAQLAVIKKEIDARNNLIGSISQEIDLLSREMTETNNIIASLEADVARLKAEYAELIYQASKSNGYFDKLTFVFSAETFNQLTMRLKYFRQFSDARKYQVEQINKVMLALDSEKKRLRAKAEEKNILLSSEKIETENLNVVKKQQNEIASSLSQKEKELKKEVGEREKENRKLEKLIADIVRREIDKARREAAKGEKGSTTTSSGLAMTPEAAALSSTFSANARKLPWPVSRGEIVGHFGKQPHAVLKGVTVDNLGVEILTMKDESVRSVFNGKVVTVASVPGLNNIVMIQHGEYFTVYARLKSVSVKNGQDVKAKEVIGEVYTDKDGQSQLQFQVWKNSQKMDPEQWLYNR